MHSFPHAHPHSGRRLGRGTPALAAAIDAVAACPTAADVAASPWARRCYNLTRICVDQAMPDGS